jgi:hypothetical protein
MMYRAKHRKPSLFALFRRTWYGEAMMFASMVSIALGLAVGVIWAVES